MDENKKKNVKLGDFSDYYGSTPIKTRDNITADLEKLLDPNGIGQTLSIEDKLKIIKDNMHDVPDDLKYEIESNKDNLGSYSRKNKTIYLNPEDKTPLSTLAHEISHARDHAREEKGVLDRLFNRDNGDLNDLTNQKYTEHIQKNAIDQGIDYKIPNEYKNSSEIYTKMLKDRNIPKELHIPVQSPHSMELPDLDGKYFKPRLRADMPSFESNSIFNKLHGKKFGIFPLIPAMINAKDGNYADAGLDAAEAFEPTGLLGAAREIKRRYDHPEEYNPTQEADEYSKDRTMDFSPSTEEEPKRFKQLTNKLREG